MAADRRPARRAGCALAVAAALAAAGEARAQSGVLQVGWQRVEAQSVLTRGDSAVAETTFVLSRWVQNYVLNQSLRVRGAADFSWQLGYSDQREVNDGQRVQIPYGHARLTGAAGGLYVSMRPVTTTQVTQLGALVGASIESVRTDLVRVRTTQTLASGYLTLPGLPRLDVSWSRDHRAPSRLGRSSVGDRRDARLSHAAGPFSFRAYYQDLSRGEKSLAVAPDQRAYGGGAGVAMSPSRTTTLQLDYDFDGHRRDGLTTAGSAPRTGADNHRVQVAAAWTPTPQLAWNFSSWAQRIQSLDRGRRRASDGLDAQLYANYRVRTGLSLQAGGQTRLVGDGVRGFERTALAQATWDGAPRPGLRALANLSHIQTWNPFRPMLRISSLRGQTSMKLRTGMDLMADAQASANNDTLADAHTALQGGGALSLRPLRTFHATLRVTSSRVGGDLGRSANRVSTRSADVRWTPFQGLEVFGSLRGQSAGGAGAPGSTTRTAYANWAPGRSARFGVNWTRTDFDNPTGLANSLRTRREVVTAQTVLSLDRARQINLEAGILDPGTGREARTYNATFTWRFGRSSG
uniref:TIGR03016 family PEP-CTERM system-associated outer membrane protein n=1 Tax=Eiseniibacteriota bacterium TaxID=2212470 RepID=A0A832IBK9_UNCEI